MKKNAKEENAMPKVSKVVIEMTMIQVAPNQCNFQFKCMTPTKQELQQAIRLGGDEISPQMIQMVDELLIAINQFQNRLTEHGNLGDIDQL